MSVLQGYVGDFKIYSDTLSGTITSDFVAAQSDYRLSDLGGFYNWSLDAGADVGDTTNFDSSGWRTFTATLKNWSGTAERHWLTAKSDKLIEYLGKPMVCSFYYSDHKYFTGVGYITGLNPRTGADTLVDEGLTFQGRGSLVSDMTIIDSDL